MGITLNAAALASKALSVFAHLWPLLVSLEAMSVIRTEMMFQTLSSGIPAARTEQAP